jgi:uncharacterized protein with PQ loop repeat
MNFFGVWQAFLTLAQLVYTGCMVPQAITNYRIKSGRGLSKLFIVGYLNGFITQTFYTFLFDLPIGYKIFVPTQFAVMLGIIFQRLYYDQFSDRTLSFFCAFNIALAILMIPVAMTFPVQVGFLCGWASLFLFSFSQVPQLVKIYSTRSVQGFSLVFVLATGIGALFELIGSVLLALPLQTVFSAARNALFVGGCLGAFYLYGTFSSSKK